MPTIIQSVVFPKEKFSKLTALKWLYEHKFQFDDIDEKKHVYRFRQEDPQQLEDQGYLSYYSKVLPNGVIYIIATQDKRGEGLKDIARRIKHFFIGRKKGLPPPAVCEFIAKHKNEIVKDVTVCRRPIGATNFANFATMGAFSDWIKKSDYDDLFHLWIEFTTDKGQYGIEKGNVINVMYNPSGKNAECKEVPMNNNLHTSVLEMLDNAQLRMGDVAFVKYDARSNNCQDFVMAILKSNKWGNDDVYKWVKQDTEKIFKNMPSWLEWVTKIGTEFGAHADVVIHGEGTKKKKIKKMRIR